MNSFNEDMFTFIELQKGQGATVDMLAKKFTWMPPRQIATWLSKWTRRGLLAYIPFEGQVERIDWRKRGRPRGGQGHYILGRKEWKSYTHGKLEDRMEMRKDIKKW